ncbi:MAG TPA: flagellar hook-associated protein FlgK [bacterium]|nr:flagellar hook-associated protein FlgK [bacterium]
MLTSFGGIDLGYSGLQANQQALDVTGQNIANAGNEGYSRQQVIMTATTPLYGVGVGQFGTGVTVSKIQRIRDVFIDNRIISENKSYGYWSKMEELTHQLELIYNEPSEHGLQAVMDDFWTSLENLTNAEGTAEQAAARSIVIENANTLTSTVSSMYEQMQELGGNGSYAGQKNAIDYEIYTDIKTINGYAKELASLNGAILTAQGINQEPNDLLDRRDQIVKELSQLANITVTNRDADDYKVTIGGMVLAQGTNYYQIETKTDAEGKMRLYHSANGIEIKPTDGELKALVEFRDDILSYNMEGLNELAITFTEVFNEIHRTGFGLDGSTNVNFFEAIPTQTGGGIYKLTATNYMPYATTALNGNASTTEPENFEKRVQRESTSANVASGYSSINVNNKFSEAHFAAAPEGSSKITISVNGKTYTSDRLSAYSSVEEFLNKVNSSAVLSGEGVSLTYDNVNDKFIFSVSNCNSDATINQVQEDGVTFEPNGFWTSANIEYNAAISYDNVSDRNQISTNNDGVVDFKDKRLSINGYTIYYDGSVDSLQDIVNRINETKCGVTANIDPTGRFTLTATKDNDYKILSLEDNGNLLSTLGILSKGHGYFGSVTGESSIMTNRIMRQPIENAAFAFSVSEDIKNNVNKFAAIGGVDTNLDGTPDESNGPGDNTNSLKLANLKYNVYLNNGTTTFNDYYSSLISKIAVETKTAASNAETKEALINNLENLQASVSGVSLDEEFTNMIKFQQGYQACAKFINTLDEMLDVLMGLGK